MSKGKWYLVYTYTNSLETGMFRDGTENIEILLNATTKEQAIAEAKEKWAEILSKANAIWEKQKATWHTPPKTAFGEVSPNPRVIFQIPLEEN